MTFKLTPLSDCALLSNSHHSVAWANGELIDQTRFHADVKQLVATFSTLKAQHVAIYDQQAYPFCVMLFALLHSGKIIWIAGNNQAMTADRLIKQGCVLLGDWQGKEYLLRKDNQVDSIALTSLKSAEKQLIIFTSGSSGEPKAIAKSLQQLDCEIETLEDYWGKNLGQAQVLSTVSHQHIYGLLFRLLWPLAARRCFHSHLYLSPEPLFKVAHHLSSACWVASPAQLKRLDELTEWQKMSHLVAIFSAGSALSLEAATQIQQHCGHKVLEIYGSSETGGIAWRKAVDNPLWQLFKGIQITLDEQGAAHLSSPYLIEQSSYPLDDKIQLEDNRLFSLLGRIDRVVKLEEKRLSLNELEQSIVNFDEVKQAHTLLLIGKREKIAAVLVLSKQGKKVFQEQGRAALIKQLKRQLIVSFETVLLPKKWLLMQGLPLTAQGKINRDLLIQLFALDSHRYPHILYCDYQGQRLDLEVRIPPELIYFSGHFPERPILAGVTQLAWVDYFGRLFFAIEHPFLRMEVIKFKKIIQPNHIIQIQLTWSLNNYKLYFELSSTHGSHSSGRMVYGEQER